MALSRMGSNIFAMVFWNRDGATFSPKGITVHWYCALGIQKAVLYLSTGSIPNCQKPDFRSNLEKIRASFSKMGKDDDFGIENLSSLRNWFRGL